MTSIGNNAFSLCGLTSITIPNSVTSIGNKAFGGGLTSLRVDESNPYYCTENNVLFNKDKTELIYCIRGKIGTYSIPNSVTSIGDEAFGDCRRLTSVTIPNSVTSIGKYAFTFCEGLTSVTIPNSVTSIGNYAFGWCSNLTSIDIPNSVISIGNSAFGGCYRLTSVTIPNSVTSIGDEAFGGNINSLYYNSNVSNLLGNHIIVKELYYGDDLSIVYPIFSSSLPSANNLNKVVLGKNVEYIRQGAFTGASLQEFYITGEKDIYLYPYVFDNTTLSNATLYVPKSRAEYYKTTAPWNEFGKIVDLDGNELPEATQKQCDQPTIAYADGKINFSCSTEGATIHYTISPVDNKSGVVASGGVDITGLYDVTAYATAENKIQSEVVTQQIKCSSTVEVIKEVEKIVEVPVEVEKIVEKEVIKEVEKIVEVPVEVIKEVEKIVYVDREVEKLVEVHDTIFIYDDSRTDIKIPSGETITLSVVDGDIRIENAPLNSTVYIYSTSGEMLESRRVYNKMLTIQLPRNEVYIIKVGEKTLKVKI